LKLGAEERDSQHHAPAVLGDAEEAVNGHAAEEAPAPAPEAVAERRRPLAVWRERLAWVVDSSRETVTELEMSNDELEAANMRLLQLLDENRQLLGRMQRSYLSTITSLARTAEAKDPYTGGHTERVAEIALLLARELGLDESELPAINVGAIIHDIGKVGTPDQILSKPGALTAEEMREIRKHPELASHIVAELELPIVVKQMARSHHERYDGDGYPDGLIGEEIPLAARILAVADALDAMTSDRPYRDAMPLEVACAEIRENTGTQFCPRVAAALMKSLQSRNPFWTTFGQTAGDGDLTADEDGRESPIAST